VDASRRVWMTGDQSGLQERIEDDIRTASLKASLHQHHTSIFFSSALLCVFVCSGPILTMYCRCDNLSLFFPRLAAWVFAPWRMKFYRTTHSYCLYML
jgi:hypothetical protein